MRPDKDFPLISTDYRAIAIFKWLRGDLISKGAYDAIYVALNATTGEMIAVKQVEIPRTEDDTNCGGRVAAVEALKLESEILKDLDHPNVVQYLGFEETPRYLTMSVFVSACHCHIINRLPSFLEYFNGGSIASVLKKQGRFKENVTKSFTSQILDGLDYLHSKGVIHRVSCLASPSPSPCRPSHHSRD